MKLCIVAIMAIVVCGLLFISGCNKSSNETNTAPKGTPTRPAAAATPDQFAAARATFKKNCSVCHGEDGKGGLKTVDDKKLKVPNLTEGRALNYPDEDFVKQITKGGDGMPKFGDKLSREEINALVRFIRHDFQGK